MCNTLNPSKARYNKLPLIVCRADIITQIYLANVNIQYMRQSMSRQSLDNLRTQLPWLRSLPLPHSHIHF